MKLESKVFDRLRVKPDRDPLLRDPSPRCDWVRGRAHVVAATSPREGSERPVGAAVAGTGARLEVFRCYYNFIRPHSALRFGREVRTPEMQADLAPRKYTFRDIFGRSMPGARQSGRVVAWSLLSTRLTSVPRAA